MARKLGKKNGNSGSARGKKGLGSTSPVSKISVEQSKGSKRLWQVPKDVQGFTAQANEVATSVLNGEVNIERARIYASISRVISQTFTAQVQIARLTRSIPSLSLGESTRARA